MVDPSNMEFADWANATMRALQRYQIGGFTDNWQDWAVGITLDPRLNKFQPPNPFGFGDWRKWAFYFNAALGQVPT